MVAVRFGRILVSAPLVPIGSRPFATCYLSLVPTVLPTVSPTVLPTVVFGGGRLWRRSAPVSRAQRPCPSLTGGGSFGKDGALVGGGQVWRYKSTGRARGLVLLALGVVKVATAAQLRQLVLPGT